MTNKSFSNSKFKIRSMLSSLKIKKLLEEKQHVLSTPGSNLRSPSVFKTFVFVDDTVSNQQHATELYFLLNSSLYCTRWLSLLIFGRDPKV